MTVYANAGEWVTCERGHPICRVSRDLNIGDHMVSLLDFSYWCQPEPKAGTQAKDIACTECGARWFSQNPWGGNYLHFQAGWR